MVWCEDRLVGDTLGQGCHVKDRWEGPDSGWWYWRERGFISSHSTETSLFEVSGDLKLLKPNDHFFDLTFLGRAKTFLQKLSFLQLHDSTLHWFSYFFHSQSFSVDSASPTVSVNGGNLRPSPWLPPLHLDSSQDFEYYLCTSNFKISLSSTHPCLRIYNHITNSLSSKNQMDLQGTELDQWEPLVHYTLTKWIHKMNTHEPSGQLRSSDLDRAGTFSLAHFPVLFNRSPSLF